jgi:formiminotetrahydrofolate cyclodeaminase
MNIEFEKLSIEKYLELLYSKEAVPGGGGVAALCAAMAASLCGMVANLTYGKKKYAEFNEDIKRIADESLALKNKCVEYINQDAQNFIPLAKAYALPSENDEQKEYKIQTVQNSLKNAVSTPVECINAACDILLMLEELLSKGNVMVLSDVGVGAICASAAIKSAWLTILVNVNLMEDIEYANNLKIEMQITMDMANASIAKIYKKVEERL